MNKSIDLQDIVRDIYGLDAAAIGKREHFDLSAVTVYTSFPDEYTIESYGEFDMQQFQTSPDELYSLVICKGDFATNKRLLEAMQDGEERDVKEYKLMNQNKRLDGYFLYRLVPHTVQGRPTWS